MGSNKALFILGAVVCALSVGAMWYLSNRDQSGPSAAPAAKDISGVYLQRSDEPMEARFRLEVHVDGKWAMANMLSGWWGTWQRRDGKYYLKSTVGPSGPVDEPREDAIGFDGQNEITMSSWKFDRLPDARFEIPMDGVSVR